MSRPHRPFWVLRHRVTGATKVSGYGDCEDGIWQVALSDGSDSTVIVRRPVRGRPTPRYRGGSSRKASKG
jgi:hypothetical protein